MSIFAKFVIILLILIIILSYFHNFQGMKFNQIPVKLFPTVRGQLEYIHKLEQQIYSSFIDAGESQVDLIS